MLSQEVEEPAEEKSLEIRLKIDPEIYPEVCEYLNRLSKKKKRGSLIVKILNDYVQSEKLPIASRNPQEADDTSNASAFSAGAFSNYE